MACSKNATPERNISNKKADYRQLLEPSNQWALNFILNTANHKELSDSIVMKQLLPQNDPNWSFSLVGSGGQGLAMPSLQFRYTNLPKGVPHAVDPISDIDIMLSSLHFVMDKHPHSQSKCVVGYSETNKTHPGYLRVVITDNAQHLDRSWWKDIVVDGEPVQYLGNSMLTGDQHPFTQNGPAALYSSKTYPFMMEQESGVDIVRALKCSTWPAKDWTTRNRPSGWPSDETLAKIESEGCHIVGKIHPLTKGPDAETEFRYSFSEAENTICRTLTTEQKQCFHLLRQVLKNVLEQVSPSTEQYKLSSYHQKTALLWLCEEISADSWTSDSTGSCILALLDKLLEFLDVRNIPNYFMPENNMIDHFPRPVIEELIKVIQQVRADPVVHLFDSFNRLSVLFNDSPYDLFRPVIKVLGCTSNDSRLEACVYTLQIAARSVNKELFAWKWAMLFMQKQSKLLSSLGSKVSPSLLLSILFVDRHQPIISFGHLNASFIYEHQNSFPKLLLDVACFLLAQRNFSSAIPILQKARTLIQKLPESNPVDIMRTMLSIMLGVAYQQVGNNCKALQCFLEGPHYRPQSFDGFPEEFRCRNRHLLEPLFTDEFLLDQLSELGRTYLFN